MRAGLSMLALSLELHGVQYQWRIQDFKKGGSTSTQMHSQGLPDSCAQ